ncbi:MAG: PAS domain S-box protein [Ginsengibacter sp.]
MPSLVLLTDSPYFTIAAVNAAYLNATGKTESDLIGKSVIEVIKDDTVTTVHNAAKKLSASLETVLTTKQSHKMAVQRYNNSGFKSGQNEWYGITENIPIHDNKGKVAFINLAITDITDKILLQKKQENTGGKSPVNSIHTTAISSRKHVPDGNRVKFNQDALINSTGDLIWSVDRKFKLIAANSAFIQSLEVISGLKFKPGDDLMMQNVFPKDFLISWKELYKRGLSGESFKKEIYQPPSNHIKESWSEIYFNPVCECGEVSGIVCYSKNITERKLAEEENIFKVELLNTIGQAVIATSLDGVIIFWNKMAEKIYGWTVLEAIGKNIADLTPAQQSKEQAAEIMNELSQGHSWSGEFMVQGKDGRKFPAYVNDAPFYDRDNKLTGIIGISTDITEQKEADTRIRNSEQQYRTLFEQNLAGFYQSTIRGVLLKCNDAFAKMLKYDSQAEVLGINANEFYFSVAERKDFIADVIHHKKLKNYEGVLKCKDGSPLYFLENISLGKNEVTGEDFFDGILIDITKRKKAEDALLTTSIELQEALSAQLISRKKTEESEKRFRQIVETAQEGIWLIDENDCTIFINQKMCDIIEYSAQDLLGQRIYHFMNDESAKNSIGQIERRRQGINEIHDSVFVTKSGKDVWVNISTNPVTNENGEYKGALAMVTDITERKKSELLLKESNERFINITRATFDAIWDWDLLAKDIYWGEGFHTIFGYQLDEIRPGITSWTDHIHKDDIERVVKGVYEFIEGTETNWVEEYRFLKTDLSYAFVIDRGFVIRNEKGKAIRMVGAMQDITAKKELENLLDKATRMARIGTWEVDLVKGTLYWSAITKEIHETPVDFIPDLQTAINFYKEGYSRELINQCIKDAIDKEINFDVELQIITATGKEKWVRSLGESEFVNGLCVRLYGSFQDIDVLKTAELVATQILVEKNVILESIGDAFFAVDKNWTVTYWNNRAEKVMGKPKNEILNHNLWEVYKEAIDSDLYTKYHEAIETNEALHFESYFGPLATWYEISAYPSKSGLSVYFKDVSERKLSNIRLNKLNENLQIKAKELATSNAELEQFAYVASHDLQEPLRMVASFLTQLEKKYGDVIDDAGKKYIAFAVDGAKRMRQIILDLLEYSRVGRMEDKLEPVVLNDITEEIQVLFRKQINEKKAHIEVGKLPVIRAYKAPLRQVFQNLISNALKYTRMNVPPDIRVTARKLINHWQFSVADNGIGIDEAYFDKIFIIFQRLHGRNEFPGTGMGLAVTKKIIENLGGKIWLESKEGKGSTFYFTIPKSLK